MLSLLGAMFVLGYRLDAKGHEAMLVTLAGRRAAMALDSPLSP